MGVKTIKRTVIMRERDLVKVVCESIPNQLWDRVDSEPLTYKGIQQDILINALINPDAVTPKFSTLPDLYTAMLYKERDLYNKKYLSWHLTMDYPDGQIYVRSRRDQPNEPLVRAKFEKDLNE